MQANNFLKCVLEYCVARTNKRYNKQDPAGTWTRILQAATRNTAALLVVLPCCHVSAAAVVIATAASRLQMRQQLAFRSHVSPIHTCSPQGRNELLQSCNRPVKQSACDMHLQ